MAHKMLKPYSILLYFLALIAFFFIGVSFAGIVGAGKNQGLAGGAIVFGYGIMAAGIGFFLSFYVANKSSRKHIIRTNAILVLIIIGFYAYFHLKYLDRQKSQEEKSHNLDKPLNGFVPVFDASNIS